MTIMSQMNSCNRLLLRPEKIGNSLVFVHEQDLIFLVIRNKYDNRIFSQ